MFPRVGSQTFTEPGSPEDFHLMEVKNVSRDSLSVTSFRRIASATANKLARRVYLPGHVTRAARPVVQSMETLAHDPFWTSAIRVQNESTWAVSISVTDNRSE